MYGINAIILGSILAGLTVYSLITGLAVGMNLEEGNFSDEYDTENEVGSDKAALEEKERHDKALEPYQVAYVKYMRNRTKLLDWIATNTQRKAEAKQNFTNTDYAFKPYNQAHPDKPMVPPKEPKFSDFYHPSQQQKNGELMFAGAEALVLGYAAFRFL